MEDTGNLIRVFYGTEVTVDLLKSELEKTGITAMIQGDQNTGVASGSFGGYPSDFELYIEEHDLKKAAPIIQTFIKLNQQA